MPWTRRASALCLAVATAFLIGTTGAAAQSRSRPGVPALTTTVNDFARVIDEPSRSALDRLSRQLTAASGDVVVVATVPTVEPYADIREYAVELFANGGRGIGEQGKDNGLLVLLALKERQLWIEVGYGLEPIITDGFAGETTRAVMLPEFRDGRYGAGLVMGVRRLVARIAEVRQVTLPDLGPPSRTRATGNGVPLWVIIVVFLLFALISRAGGGPGRSVRRWGRGGWSGWSSGVGPFGGGWTGGSSGGFGGGFGGFGGGRSGGGGGGGRW